MHKLPLYWKQSASLLSPAALADDGGDKVGDDEALPLSSAVLLTAGAVVSAVVVGVVVAGNRFLAPIDPFLKRTSWRGVEILVYSSVKKKRKKKDEITHKVKWRAAGDRRRRKLFSSAGWKNFVQGNTGTHTGEKEDEEGP